MRFFFSNVISFAREQAGSWIVWLLVGMGFGLRLDEFWDNSSLWWDEAALALNILGRSFAGLTQELEHFQAAPLGFLWLVKSASLLWGNSEMALRSVSLGAGGLALIGYAFWVKHLLPRPWAWLALSLFVLSAPHIRYSVELKQYALDPLAALVILWLVQHVRTGKAGTGWRLSLGAALILWFSHAALLMLASALGWLGLEALYRKDRALKRVVFWAGLACGVSFALNFWWILRPTAGSPYFHHTWQEAFAPWPTSWESGSWYLESWLRQFHASVGLAEAGLAACLWILGLWGVWQQRSWAAAQAITPLFFALGASFLERYPFAQRFLLFSAPLQIFLCVLGLHTLSNLLRDFLSRSSYFGRWFPSVVVGVLALALLLNPLRKAEEVLRSPAVNEEMRFGLEYLQSRLQPGTPLLIQSNAGLAYAYYALTRPELAPALDFQQALLFQHASEINPIPPQAWIFFTHISPHERQQVLAEWSALGEIQPHLEKKGIYLYFFQKAIR